MIQSRDRPTRCLCAGRKILKLFIFAIRPLCFSEGSSLSVENKTSAAHSTHQPGVCARCFEQWWAVQSAHVVCSEPRLQQNPWRQLREHSDSSHLWPWTSFCCGIFRDLLAVARLSQPLVWDTQFRMELGSISKARVCSTHIPRSYCLLLVSLSRALWNESYFWNLAAVNFLSWSLVLTASASGKHDYHFKRTAILEKVMFALQRKNILTSAPWSNRTNV